RVRLHRQHTDGPPLRFERNAEPAHVLGRDADVLELALLDQLSVSLCCEELWLTGAHYIAGRPSPLTIAELKPFAGVGPIVVELVCPIRPVDQLPLLVVQRDEEVPRRHELPDN